MMKPRDRRYVRNGQIVESLRFQCVFCRQKCSSFAILCAHEGSCETRRARERSFADARRKHTGRANRGRDWNLTETERSV